MNLITALIAAPLIAIRPGDTVLHAASFEAIGRGWPSKKYPRPRKTVDAVCGATTLKLVPDLTQPGYPLPWPPPGRLRNFKRCKACFDASYPKRPRTAPVDRALFSEHVERQGGGNWPDCAPTT